MFYGDKVTITLNELNLVLHFLPDLFLTLYDESFRKSFTKKISNYFKICPGQNSTELLEKLSNNSNSFDICSLVLINPKHKVDVELGSFFKTFMQVSIYKMEKSVLLKLQNVARCKQTQQK